MPNAMLLHIGDVNIVHAPVLHSHRVQCSETPSPAQNLLINIHTLSSQICPRKINLLHKLRMRLWNIIEREHPKAEFEEQVSTEGNDGPEWKL